MNELRIKNRSERGQAQKKSEPLFCYFTTAKISFTSIVIAIVEFSDNLEFSV